MGGWFCCVASRVCRRSPAVPGPLMPINEPRLLRSAPSWSLRVLDGVSLPVSDVWSLRRIRCPSFSERPTTSVSQRYCISTMDTVYAFRRPDVNSPLNRSPQLVGVVEGGRPNVRCRRKWTNILTAKLFGRPRGNLYRAIDSRSARDRVGIGPHVPCAMAHSVNDGKEKVVSASESA